LGGVLFQTTPIRLLDEGMVRKTEFLVALLDVEVLFDDAAELEVHHGQQ
jgi:hypothetical protein